MLSSQTDPEIFLDAEHDPTILRLVSYPLARFTFQFKLQMQWTTY